MRIGEAEGCLKCLLLYLSAVISDCLNRSSAGSGVHDEYCAIPLLRWTALHCLLLVDDSWALSSNLGVRVL